MRTSDPALPRIGTDSMTLRVGTRTKPSLRLLAVAVLVLLTLTLVEGQSSANVGEVNQARSISEVTPTRLARLGRVINLSHWFSQSIGNDYSKAHLESHTTAEDIALIKSLLLSYIPSGFRT
jgi:hypothetical protein